MSCDLHQFLEREWLAVNKIGGFASSTAAGVNTRKYHGLLVAAMSPPVRRMVLLSRVEETVACDGWVCPLACSEYPDTFFPRGDQSLVAFDHDPFPRWAYQGEGWTIEKSLRLLHGQNTVVLSYSLLGGRKPVELEIRPLLALRSIHELMYQWSGKWRVDDSSPGQVHVPPTARTPEVFFAHDGSFETDPHWNLNTIYRRERERGYSGLEDLWNPGVVRWSLKPGQTAHLICSSDRIDFNRTIVKADRQWVDEMAPRQSAKRFGQPMDMLLRAADQFVANWASDNGGQIDFALASFPWAPPSPRQTLIGFTGLFLVSGKITAARGFLLSMIDRMVDGIIPSSLSEDGGPAKYAGADVPLWFVNAVYQLLRYSNQDECTRGKLTDAVLQIINAYAGGTRLGIQLDADGLVQTHQPGIATSWMDAKVGDWVVTARKGKPVELNALWYNALKIAECLCAASGHREKVDDLSRRAASVKVAFNNDFWNGVENCCFDVVDQHGHDPSVRPNQLLAISLPFPVLLADRFESVVEKVRLELLTPVGVRTLSPKDPAYQGHCTGNIVARDRAYHQGSAFPWLLGAYVTAYLKVHGRGPQAREEARDALNGCITHMQQNGVGQLCELFDGDKPNAPGGAIASASAVAEVLRVYAEEILAVMPPKLSTTEVTNPARV